MGKVNILDRTDKDVRVPVRKTDLFDLETK